MGTNYVDNLLSKIEDENLRELLIEEINKLRDNKEFGLVFERHIPEYVRLHKRNITEGVNVQIRESKGDEIYSVREMKGKKAVIVNSEGEISTVNIKELVVVTKHGEPIFPGLIEVDRVERGGDKSYHSVINAENYHALQLLLYTHEGKVDCIYIDPPYNTGAKDWKYNNNYVDSEDRYRHSKWLSFMDKRLRLAKRLLKNDSVLIVTIDEKEYLRLGLLLEQIFPNSNIQMVSITISPRGTNRPREFSRIDEYAFFVFSGNAAPGHMKIPSGKNEEVRWQYLRRDNTGSERASGRPNQFYPIFVSKKTQKIVGFGEPLNQSTDRNTVSSSADQVAVFPVRANGTEMVWGLTGESLMEANSGGFVRVSKGTKNPNQPYTISYVTDWRKNISQGIFKVDGERKDGTKIVVHARGKVERTTTVWREKSHDAGAYGTSLLKSLIPDAKFPFPKSLYAVEDTLRVAIGDNPHSLVLDFFGGSGTTCHAVMRLNKQDGGSRKSILITNNAVSAEEEEQFQNRGISPLNQEWIDAGIFYSITKPRLTAAATGRNLEGVDLEGSYTTTDEFPLSDGFKENIIFNEIHYVDDDKLSRRLEFKYISTILWMISGSIGTVIDGVAETFALQPEGRYGILFYMAHWQEFVDAVKETETMTHVFIITDSKAQYQQVVKHLPTNINATMLYEDYLTNFQIGV